MLKYVSLSEMSEKNNPAPFPHYNSFEELPNTNPIVIVDMSENIVYANQSFKNMFGAVNCSKITSLKTEPDLEQLLKAFVQSNYSAVECEITLLTSEYRSQKNYSVPIERVFVKGIEYLVLIFIALDQKIKLEQKINNLNNAFEYGNIPIIITDSSGRITYATTFFEKILNTRIELLYNCFIQDVLVSYLDEKENQRLDFAVKSLNEWSTVIGGITSGSKLNYYELKLIPIKNYYDSTSFILSGNDITQHIIKTQLIKKNEMHLRSIINNISDLLLLIKKKDKSFLFEDANENFCKTFSVDKKNTGNLTEILPVDLMELLLQNIEHPEIDKQIVYEFNCAGSERHYIIKISYVANNIDNETIYIISLSDITDQILFQDQLKKAYDKENHFNKLKSSILKNMSHEIRTPLNALIGYSEIIEEALLLKDYEVLKELTYSLKDILNRILNLFSNIVEVSQIETNEFELELFSQNVNKILKSVYNKKFNEAKNKKIDFKLDMKYEDIPILIDWIKMEKAIFALVDNAIKYTRSGGVIIKSEIIEDEAVISVLDTGIGMDKGKIKNLLEAFIQGEEGYTRYFEGAGLGLTIAYNYVKRMGGKFLIDAEPEKGTTIQIKFPVEESNY